MYLKSVLWELKLYIGINIKLLTFFLNFDMLTYSFCNLVFQAEVVSKVDAGRSYGFISSFRKSKSKPGTISSRRGGWGGVILSVFFHR